MPDVNILQFLDAGGSVAMMGLLYLMWRFDRRLVELEIIIKNLLEKDRGK